jgi:hypothetical protein
MLRLTGNDLKSFTELIRKDIPFAVILPLSLLDEIERTGKTSIDEVVRQKRLDMKLVIVNSLGQGWLIKWTESTEGANITPKTLSDENDIDVLCLRAVDALMKDGTSRKKLSPRDLRAQERSKRTNMFDEMESTNLEDPFKMVVAPPLQGS